MTLYWAFAALIHCGAIVLAKSDSYQKFAEIPVYYPNTKLEKDFQDTITNVVKARIVNNVYEKNSEENNEELVDDEAGKEILTEDGRKLVITDNVKLYAYNPLKKKNNKKNKKK